MLYVWGSERGSSPFCCWRGWRLAGRLHPLYPSKSKSPHCGLLSFEDLRAQHSSPPWRAPQYPHTGPSSFLSCPMLPYAAPCCPPLGSWSSQRKRASMREEATEGAGRGALGVLFRMFRDDSVFGFELDFGVKASPAHLCCLAQSFRARSGNNFATLNVPKAEFYGRFDSKTPSPPELFGQAWASRTGRCAPSASRCKLLQATTCTSGTFC